MSRKREMGGKPRKIEPIRIDDSMLEDAEMDEFLRRSIIEEADEMEKELNSNPSLRGIGASDDMFQMIKAKLQEQGVWEDHVDADAEGSEDQADSEKRAEKEIKAKETEEIKEPVEGNPVSKRGEINSTNAIDKSEKADKEAKLEILTESESEKIRLDRNAVAAEGESQDNLKKNAADAYQMLSKEDREALELGRKIKKKRANRWKQIAAAVVVCVVASAGVSTEASRRWILDKWDKLTLATGVRIATDYIDDEKNIEAYNEEEENAWLKIKNILNVPSIDFSYLPEGMVFTNCDILQEVNEAFLFYSYGESVFTIKIQGGVKKAAAFYQSDIEPVLEDEIKTMQNVDVEIWNTTDDTVESYMAIFEYEDCTFNCSGMISYSEIKKIIEFMTLI